MLMGNQSYGQGVINIDTFGNYVASVDDMLVELSGNQLRLTKDYSKTYEAIIDVPFLDIMKYCYLFENGSFLFANHQHVYYTQDWVNVYESTVYDVDGSVFAPNQYDNFTCYKIPLEKMYINGVEMIVWGNYSTDPTVQHTDKVRVWYTADNGITVKTAYIFNTPTTETTRHIHAIDFNPFDNTFWLQTGDLHHESHWIKGVYDLENDEWSWDTFATGLNFKTTNMIFHPNGYVYWSWDIAPGGGVRAPMATLGDITTHEILVRTNKDCHFLIVGPRGDVCVFQTAWGGTEMPRNLYYAPDGVNFVKIEGGMPSGYDAIIDAQYQTYWPINRDGKILAGVQALSQYEIRDWRRTPSAFVDDFIRAAGYPSAFKP